MNAHDMAATIIRLQDLASRLNKQLIQTHDQIDSMRKELQSEMDVCSAVLDDQSFTCLVAMLILRQDEVNHNRKIWRELQEQLLALRTLRPELVPL